MGAHVHKLSEVDEENRTAVCAACGPVKVKRKGSYWRCKIAGKKWQNNTGARPRARKDRLAGGCVWPRCTTTIWDSCQLHIDHIDGNRLNNEPENLQVLCASCHAYKTYLNKDFRKKYIA